MSGLSFPQRQRDFPKVDHVTFLLSERTPPYWSPFTAHLCTSQNHPFQKQLYSLSERSKCPFLFLPMTRIRNLGRFLRSSLALTPREHPFGESCHFHPPFLSHSRVLLGFPGRSPCLAFPLFDLSTTKLPKATIQARHSPSTLSFNIPWCLSLPGSNAVIPMAPTTLPSFPGFPLPSTQSRICS